MSVGHHLSLIGYVGGKLQQLHWLLPLLPTDARVYCEPFGGSAAVLLNRPRAAREVYNDMSRNTTNLFRVIQVPDNAAYVAEHLRLMPFHYTEYINGRELDDLSDGLERAWRYYMKCRQSRFGIGSVMQAGWGVVLTFDTINQGPSPNVRVWWKSIEKIGRVSQRMRDVEVRHGPALDVIRELDAPDAFFYLDPPYVMSSRQHSDSGYYEAGEMTDDDHVELLECLAGLKGRWVLSGYDNPLYASMLASAHTFRPPAHRLTIVNAKKDRGDAERQEVIWSNFSLDGRNLFSDAA